ncbi:MAG: yidC [Gammaproteobacteria bacterium]|jgi:YidC/Oxa1 family membrane protein insertase|nr:yidC [Gammaproteobacteria bacterium]
MFIKLLDSLRIALYGAVVAILLLFYQAWEKEHNTVTTFSTLPITNGSASYIPEIKEVSNEAKMSTAPSAASTNIKVATNQPIIHVTTDVLQADIDTVGGNITKIKLLQYPATLHSTQSFLLLNDSPDSRYLAQSGFLSSEGPDTIKSQAVYSIAQKNYLLEPNQQEITVKLYWQNSQGIKITKSFIFKRSQYNIDMEYHIDNQSPKPWDGHLYMQLLRKNSGENANQNRLSTTATYFGAAISSPEKRFQKIPFTEMRTKNLDKIITGGWAAMIQHYFVSAWIPDNTMPLQYFSHVTDDGLYTIGMISPKISVQPGETITSKSKFYSGPAIASNLDKVAPSLKLTIDYGWFWFISGIIFWMMQHIYNVIGNWGWSIVLVTIIIKLMFYHLSAKSYRSMSGMKKLQPKIALLKERFGEDKQKLTQATLELYKKEKVNPMSGCLPILIQIPVFIGLYWVLIESVQLRQAPFIFWIHDLSIKDPFYVLPVLMGLSMFLQQRLNPPPPDPMQAKIMMLMPIVFTALFLNFPAGLMLYWFVNNTLSFLQQWVIMRNIENPKNKKKRDNAK